MKMETNTEKTDWKALLKAKLPLSQKTYIELRRAKAKGHIKWTDMSNELKVAYGSYGAEERTKSWDKAVEEGKWRWWQ